MTSAEGLLLTEEGWQKLRAELWALEAQRASSAGDLRDMVEANRPGDRAQSSISELDLIERRITDLRQVLADSMVIGKADRDPETVGVGSTVTVRWEDGEEEAYVIVGPPEVNLLSGRISYESPVGRALLGQRIGGQIEVSTPGGSKNLLVLAVE